MDKNKLAEIIRVDHAGEFGAKRIYQGQLDFCKNPNTKEILKEMLDGEIEHFEFFDKEIKARKIRPTALQPIWSILGYGLGAATSLMGEKAAMACTVAIEETIEEHYQEQLNQLEKTKEEKPLKAKIKKFREEELEHRQTAITHKALEAPFYKTLETLIKTGSKLAITLSKRI